MKNNGVQNYSVQYNGYNLIGVTTVERGDGSYDSTSLFNITYVWRAAYAPADRQPVGVYFTPTDRQPSWGCTPAPL